MKQVGAKVGVVVTGSKGVGKQVGAGRAQTLGAMPYPASRPKGWTKRGRLYPHPLVPDPRERWVSLMALPDLVCLHQAGSALQSQWP